MDGVLLPKGEAELCRHLKKARARKERAGNERRGRRGTHREQSGAGIRHSLPHSAGSTVPDTEGDMINSLLPHRAYILVGKNNQQTSKPTQQLKRNQFRSILWVQQLSKGIKNNSHSHSPLTIRQGNQIM